MMHASAPCKWRKKLGYSGDQDPSTALKSVAALWELCQSQTSSADRVVELCVFYHVPLYTMYMVS